jgi:fumarylacetoacetase
MNPPINETHNPGLRSWIESANDAGTDFPIQNLPFGAFKHRGSGALPHIGVAIGDHILDLAECRKRRLLDGLAGRLIDACAWDALNALMSLGAESWSALRRRISRLLRVDGPQGQDEKRSVEASLVSATDVDMVMPARIGDYTDFYASIHHAQNVGSMFRPDNPLLPNYKHVPVGYHGRASSIVISGTPVRRPCGQTEGKGATPDFGPSRMLDFELEVGAFVGPGNPLTEPISVAAAESHLFGLCLVNDWSARDIQRWEYQPLGPFLAKSFATTISPWIVTTEALAPFRVPAFHRQPGDPEPLPYLDAPENLERGGIDLILETLLCSKQMRARGTKPLALSRGNFREMYWTVAQLIAHHASNGCNLRPGDLLASGTVSGPDKGSRGCLLELTWRGTDPIGLPGGEERRFLEDGDEVIFRASAQREGFARIGFGECRGSIMPARELSILNRAATREHP